MNWLRAQWNACRQACLRLAGSPLNTLLAILAIGITLALPAAGYLLLSQVAAIGPGGAAAPQFTLFLKLDADRKTTLAVDARLRDRGDVAKTEILLRENTLERMKASEGLADVIAALPKNPFPDAIVVTPAGDRPEMIDKLAAETRQWREVAHVQADPSWARRFAALVNLARTALGLLTGLLGIGLVAITFNTVRLQIMSRRMEIEVSSLLGATEGFVRRPFLWQGGLLGLLGGGVAWLIVAAAMLSLRAPVEELAQLYGHALSLLAPLPGEGGILLVLAGFLGWLGAVLSMRQYWRNI